MTTRLATSVRLDRPIRIETPQQWEEFNRRVCQMLIATPDGPVMVWRPEDEDWRGVRAAVEGDFASWESVPEWTEVAGVVVACPLSGYTHVESYGFLPVDVLWHNLMPAPTPESVERVPAVSAGEANPLADRIAGILQDYRGTDDEADFSTSAAIEEILCLLLEVETLARAADPDAWGELVKPGMGERTAHLRRVQMAARRQNATEHAERIVAHLRDQAVPRD